MNNAGHCFLSVLAIGAAIHMSCSRATEPSKPNPDARPAMAETQPRRGPSAGSESELAAALARAAPRLEFPLLWAWAPDRHDKGRFPYFERGNELRWNLDLSAGHIPVGTVWESTSNSEEGGTVSEYVVFDDGFATWWFDGRKDRFSEFKEPSVRKARVLRLFLAVHDGKSAMIPVESRNAMPLDHGLGIGIAIEGASVRYW